MENCCRQASSIMRNPRPGKVNHVRPDWGVFACWDCTVHECTLEVKTAKQKRAYGPALSNPRVCSSYGKYLLARNWTKAAERAGPVITVEVLDQLNLGGRTLEDYLSNEGAVADEAPRCPKRPKRPDKLRRESYLSLVRNLAAVRQCLSHRLVCHWHYEESLQRWRMFLMMTACTIQTLRERHYARRSGHQKTGSLLSQSQTVCLHRARDHLLRSL